jgi:hypothetical protein
MEGKEERKSMVATEKENPRQKRRTTIKRRKEK